MLKPKFYKSASEMAAEIENERLKDSIEKLSANLDYVAMMTDINIENGEETNNE